MIAVNKADECIQEEISRHDEELSGIFRGRPCGPNKKIGQLKKRLNNAKTREKSVTHKRKVRDQSESWCDKVEIVVPKT